MIYVMIIYSFRGTNLPLQQCISRCRGTNLKRERFTSVMICGRNDGQLTEARVEREAADRAKVPL